MKRIAQAGIRFKIMIGALVLLLLLAGAVTMTYAIVRQVENKTGFLVAFDDVLRATLELRRFEKNYFLFRTERDYQEALRYLSRLNVLVVQHRQPLEDVLDSAELTRLLDDLTSYEQLMRMVHAQKESGAAAKAAREAARTRIRELGQEVTVFAEDTARQQRGDVQILLDSVKRSLVWSTLFIVLMLLAIALFVGRGVVNSLKILEGYTRRIARGDFVDVPVKVADKEIVSLLVAFRRMTNELWARQQRLVQSEKLASLGTLVAGVAHELNNPLSNISTSAQILREELMEGDLFQRELVDQVEDQADRARDIVQSLLEFSRVKEISRETICCADLFSETLLLLRGQMPSYVTVDMEVEDGLCVFVDKQKLQQVLLNLLKNAMDAVGEQGMIWITADKVTRPGKKDMIEIMIEDNGAGIPQEQVKRIFDPFFTTKDVGYGTGLGLFLVHDIIQSHGGSITVDSRIGEGTTFIIWLPVQEKKND